MKSQSVAAQMSAIEDNGHRGSYIRVRGYKFYLRVFDTISQHFLQHPYKKDLKQSPSHLVNKKNDHSNQSY